MKKYLFGIIAIVFAVAAAAFTPVSKKLTASFAFHYVSSFYDQSSVQSNSNWAYGNVPCPPNANRACEIIVTENYTHLAGATRVLNSSGIVLVIRAVPGVNRSFYVPVVGASIGIVSKSDKE